VTISVLRPNSDVKKAGLAYSAGTTAWSLLDDGGAVSDYTGADDASYVRAPSGAQYPAVYLHLGLTNLPALPATRRIRALRMRTRLRMNTSVPGDAAIVHLDLWDPISGTGFWPPGDNAAERAAGPVGFATGNASTFQPFTSAWDATPPPKDGKEWTKAVVDRLELHVVWYMGDVGYENLRVSELYVDADLRDQATVSAVTAAGYTTSSRPTISWTFTPNADADPQIAWHVRVFSAAQTGIAGFDPASSPATWDSGEQAGSGELAVLGTDLIDGSSYQAYVRAAASFNGARWWSGWAAGSAFTVSLTAPPTPLLEVTTDATVPWLRNIIKATVPANLLSENQSSLEVDTAGWTAGADTTISRSTAAAAHGAAALQLAAPASGANLLSTNISSIETDATGWPANFNASSTVRTTSQAKVGAASLQVTAGSHPSGVVGVSTTDGPTATPITAGQLYELVAYVRAATAGRKISADIWWLDAAGTTIVGQVETPEAEMPLDVTTGWTAVRVQGVAPAGAARAQVGVYYGRDIAGQRAAAGEVHYVDDVWLHTTTAFAGTISALTTPAGAGAVPVRGGQQYTATAEFRAATVGRQCGVLLEFYRADASLISSTAGPLVSDSTSAWTRAVLTAAAPVDATQVVVRLQVTGVAVDEVHQADKLGLWPGADQPWSVGGLVGGGQLQVERSWATTGAGNLAPPQLWGGGDALRAADGVTVTGTYSTVSYDRAERVHGEGSFRWDVYDTASKLWIGWYWGADPGLDLSPAYALAAVPGRVYSFSLYAKASQDFSSQLSLQAIDRDGNPVGGALAGPPLTIGSIVWQELKVEGFTVPPGAVWVKASLANSAAVTARSVWVDHLWWGPGATVGSARQPSGQPALWSPVRGAAGQDLPVPGLDGVSYLFDAEVPPGYTVTYRARTSTTVGEEPVGSPYSAYAQTMLDPPGVWVLKAVGSPTSALQVSVPPDGLERAQHEETTVFYPLRPTTPQHLGQRPVVLSDFLGGQDGSLQLTVLDDDEWQALQQIIQTPGACFLVLPGFGALYLRFLERSWPETPYADTTVKTRRELRLPFLEVDRPPP
jgi:hypothetical protein